LIACNDSVNVSSELGVKCLGRKMDCVCIHDLTDLVTSILCSLNSHWWLLQAENLCLLSMVG